jgi:hypothetical protein
MMIGSGRLELERLTHEATRTSTSDMEGAGLKDEARLTAGFVW